MIAQCDLCNLYHNLSITRLWVQESLFGGLARVVRITFFPFFSFFAFFSVFLIPPVKYASFCFNLLAWRDFSVLQCY